MISPNENGHASGQTVTWTLEKMHRFARTILSVEEANGHEFTFEGNEYDLRYAQYLLAYLEERFKNK